MDFKAELNTQVAEEDDGYYAEIRKQIILLLTTYDDDEDVERPPKTAAKRGAEQSGRRHPQSERNLSWCLNGNDLEGPVWHVNSWENGNGTGVFIPQAVKYKRYSIFRRMRKHERKEKHRLNRQQDQGSSVFSGG